MNLGWHVMIRQPVSIALVEVRSLQHQILAIGFVISLLLLFVTYRLANRFSRPIENLAKSAHAVEQGREDVYFEANTSIREIKGLSQSLNSMTDTLLTQKHQLMDANTTLEQKVQERTQELKTANIELEKLARHDALTGLYNRGALTDYLDYLYAQFTRSHVGYAVLLLDVDYFKKVNDQYGHEVGDRVLKGWRRCCPRTSVSRTLLLVMVVKSLWCCCPRPRLKVQWFWLKIYVKLSNKPQFWISIPSVLVSG
jgi:diguanylate cyclase